MTSNGVTFLEKEPFLRLFNRNGYVLDFGTERFDDFTQESIGVRLCDKYRLSKGRSLESFVSEASADQIWKLFADLLKYYESFYIQEDASDAKYGLLYQKCKQVLSSHSTEARKAEDSNSMYFNVIIRADESFHVENERIFEETVPTVAARFKNPDGTPNFELLRTLPTITSPEYADNSSAIAQIGYLGADLSQYLNSVVASFPAVKLNRILASTRWRGLRTRWMVFEGDPYKMLGDLRNNYNPVQSEAVLQFPNTPINNKQIAVMMPFNPAYPTPDMDPVYGAIKEAATQLEYECIRVDEIQRPTDITQDILKLIEGSKIIIADLSGANPNVYYEMGLAHARGRIVVPISRDKEKLPFDNSHIRTIFYHADDKYSLNGLTEQLVKALKAL